jgi:SNF2 family DNA or RNA helicase
LASTQTLPLASIHAGRILPETYQFVPAARLLDGPRPSLLIADDVGLGKTIEAGICLMELIARGRARRILLVIPPGLIAQWQEEMREEFGLTFHCIENAGALDRAQTALAEGLKPWHFLNRVITSVDYLKRREVLAGALDRPWDVIVVDEAHALAESGTPRNPYATQRTRLGRQLRGATTTLILLTATPHNGHRHSFRSLLELVAPTDATFAGDREVVHLSFFSQQLYLANR